MNVERYEQAKHYADFEKWYVRRTQGAMGPEFLPKVGYVVPGVAMGFLYQTDSKVSLIEALVANPDVPVSERTKGIDAVVLAIIGEAQRLGFKVLYGQTDLPVIVERAKRLGFVHDPTQQTTVTYFLEQALPQT